MPLRSLMLLAFIGWLSCSLPAAAEPPSGDAVIRGKAGPSDIVITTTSRVAGAIHSLTWNGKEFIDSTDHGRQLQSACAFDCGDPKHFWAEAYNPTEAGSRKDGAGPKSSSKLLSIDAAGRELSTTTQMAFWLAPGEKFEGHAAKNDKVLSPFLVSKRVRIGYQELPHAIECEVTFTVPEGEKHTLAQFEVLTGYMPAEFSQFETFNPETGESKSIDDGPGEQWSPLVFSTEDGRHAMGVFAPKILLPGLKGPGYGRWRFKAEKVVKWNCVFRDPYYLRGADGVLRFRLFVAVGAREDVRRTLAALQPSVLEQAPNTWVKRSPVKGGPPSPGMGYETSLGYDRFAGAVIRWGGHNPGGGGEQNAETWAYHLRTNRWELKEPNTSPPGVCCAQQNVFDSASNRFLRFPAFSGSHGWQWFREIYLNNSTVWAYDLRNNEWRDLRPLPAPRVAPLRCAAWESDHEVAVLFGGEGSNEGTLVYDPYTNTWARMNPKVQPEGRSGGNMAYDSGRKKFILLGSQFGNDKHTWAYDLRKNEWRDLKPELQPPTDRNDAVLAYDGDRKVAVAVVRIIDKELKDEIVAGHLETWAYDADKNTWKKMNPPREPDGWANRRRVLCAASWENVLLMEVYANPTERIPGVDREQQIWTYRRSDRASPPDLVPPIVHGPQPSPHRINIDWTLPDNATGGVLHRGAGSQPWQADMKMVSRVDAQTGTFEDTKVQRGVIYHYAMKAFDKDNRESEFSDRKRAQPRAVEEVTASVIGPQEVRLTWRPPQRTWHSRSADSTVVGYHVERAPVEVFTEDQILRLKKDTPPLTEPSVGAIKAIGRFERLTKEPLEKPEFTDTTIDLSKPQAVEGEPLFKHRFRDDQLDPKGKSYRLAVYAYRVRAVNALGVESGPSPWCPTIPSAPQWVFAREDGERCQLKWAANPEQGIKGYLVYRMESPRVNGPGQPVTRLTAEPANGTRFTDEKAGKETRRYWVVAVDALGQEGFPSAPVWHERQYRKYYEPFVGSWHQ
jgi:hypothetical protein